MLTLTCNYCGDEFGRYPSQAKGNRGKYCSRSCKAKDKTGEDHPNWNQVEDECDECGKTYSRQGYRDDSRFCSYKCHHESMYTGGSNRYGPNWEKIADGIRQDADNECFVCGTTSDKSLPVHHIIPVKEFDNIEDAHFKENLVVLCVSHHMKIEKTETVAEQCDRFNRNPTK